jgi:hypothetical protein
VSARAISVSVANGGKGRATIAHGGSSGVREGWEARGKFQNGTPFEAQVVDVHTRSCLIELPDEEAARAIDGNVELRPPSR